MNETDSEVIRLRDENQRLAEELSQAKSDKEFVWSLWKRLQVASPDLTQAISMVVQREKEKAEVKDAKVLQILQFKDAKIEELHQIVTKQSKELTQTIQKKAELIDRVKKLEAEVITSSEQAKQLTSKLSGLDSNAEEKRRQVVAEYERQQRELSEKVTALQVELTRVKSEAGDRRADNIVLESRSAQAEREVTRLRSEVESAKEEAKRALSHAQVESQRLQEELEERKAESARLMTRLESSQSQMAQQSALLTKMETLENNKDNMLYSREKVVNKNMEELIRQIASLTAENRTLKRRMRGGQRLTMTNLPTAEENEEEEEEEEEDGMERRRRASSESDGPVVDLSYRMERLQRQVRLLEGNLHRREAIIRSLREAATPCPQRTRPAGPYVRQNRTTRLRSRSAPLRAPRRCLQMDSLQRQLSAADRRAADLESELATKDEEICTLRQDLEQRCRRLQQLRFEMRRQRSAASDLSQRRESEAQQRREEVASAEAAWREMAQLQEANRELQDELSRTRRGRLKDESTIFELRHRVKHDGDTAEVDAREKERLTAELEQLRLQMRLAEEQRASDDRQTNNSMGMAQRSWEAERRGLRAELQSLAEELSQKRLQLTSLEREVASLRSSEKASNAMAGILEHFAQEEERAGKVSSESEPSQVDETASTSREPSSGRRTQNSILRKRLAALQQQLRSVRKSRSHLTASLTSVQQRNRQLSQQLEAATARCQRLRSLRTIANNNSAMISEGEEEEQRSSRRGGGEAEAKARAEAQRLATAVRTLKEEVSAKDSRLVELQERTARSERDLGQKRALIEDLRSKARAAQDAAKADKEATELSSQRLRELAETGERQRVQLESLKRRLAAVTAEKKRLESESAELRTEAERKGKVASEASARRADLERKFASSEKAHEEKMNGVVRRSEAGVSAARAKVAELQTRAIRLQRLLMRVCRGLGRRAADVRSIAAEAATRRRRLQEGERQGSAESMRTARERAADILQLSLEDVDDILHPEASPARRAQQNLADEDWQRRCERLLTEGGAVDEAAAEALWRCCDEKLAQMVAAVQATARVAQA